MVQMASCKIDTSISIVYRQYLSRPNVLYLGAWTSIWGTLFWVNGRVWGFWPMAIYYLQYITFLSMRYVQVSERPKTSSIVTPWFHQIYLIWIHQTIAILEVQWQFRCWGTLFSRSFQKVYMESICFSIKYGCFLSIFSEPNPRMGCQSGFNQPKRAFSGIVTFKISGAEMFGILGNHPLTYQYLGLSPSQYCQSDVSTMGENPNCSWLVIN